MNHIRQIGLGLAGILMLGLLISSCGEGMPEEEYIVDPEDVTMERATDVDILYSDSAKVRVRVQGPTMLRHTEVKEPYQEFPDGILVEFFEAETGQITSRLTAKYAIRIENKARVIVRDSVVWKSIKDEKLETSELIWNEREENVYSNKFVVITRPDEIIYSHGFEANQDFTDLKLSAIDGRMRVDDIQKSAE